MKLSQTHIYIVKTVIHAVQLFAAVWLFFAVKNGYFGAEPVDQIIHFTGKSAIHSFIATLLVSPIAQWFKLGLLCKTRRLLGLYTFGWAIAHFVSYAWFELGFDWRLLGGEIIQRPYLVVGAISWVILAVLALTSLQKTQRNLGRNWQVIHNWIYIAALLIPLHYLWSVKSGLIEPSLYALGLMALLWFRKDKIKRWLKQGIFPSKANQRPSRHKRVNS
ncbi:MAG: protein-methionine-sulfoxide reductase heme-binding subunit MsrQ [Vibrio sp.]